MRTIEVDQPDVSGEPDRDVADALKVLADTDLMRLQAIARLRSRALPGLDWADLLQEAVLRCLDGSRAWPAGVPLVALLAMTMRSLADAHHRRRRRERLTVLPFGQDAADQALTAEDPGADPERAMDAIQALAAIDRLFAGDEIALQIIAGLAQGLSAVEIRTRHGLSQTLYDTARKRMRRALMRHSATGDGP